MKILALLAAGEKIKHTGDLTIEGDVGTGATIEVKDGALIVKGNIASDATISVQVSKELRQSSVLSMISGNSVSIGGIDFGGNSVSIGNIVVGRGANIVLGESTSANMCINGKYIGNVNINNRILTNAN